MARNAGSSYRSYLTYLAYLSYLLVLACAARISAHDPITTKVTWSREVVRIVNKSCTGCHVAGGVAPMPLATYDEARPWAKAIKDEVVARRMPKWPAARGFGHFSNDPTLSPFEIELVAAWADGGAPKGEERDLPAKSSEASATKPDLVLTLPARATPPAGEARSVAVPTSLPGGRWLTGWEFTPNDGAIVSAAFDLVGNERVADERIGDWTPPDRQVMFPLGTGQALPVRATVRVTLTYRTGTLQQDFPIGLPSKPPALRLFLRYSPPRFEVEHETFACHEGFVITDGGVPAMLYAVRIDGAAAGTPIGLDASRANSPLPIAWIRSFDPNYRPTYRLSTPVATNLVELKAETPGKDAGCRVTWDYTLQRGTWNRRIDLLGRSSSPYFTGTTNGTVTTFPAR